MREFPVRAACCSVCNIDYRIEVHLRVATDLSYLCSPLLSSPKSELLLLGEANKRLCYAQLRVGNLGRVSQVNWKQVVVHQVLIHNKLPFLGMALWKLDQAALLIYYILVITRIILAAALAHRHKDRVIELLCHFGINPALL